MTDQDAHVPTDQETAIYDALNAGDQATIEQLRDDAHSADPQPPSTPPPPGWKPPVAQYNIDHQNAWNHYQADHEAPQAEREAATRDDVADENIEADRG